MCKGLLAAVLLATPATAQIKIGDLVRVDAGRGNEPCNETTIAASKANPLEMVAAWNDLREPLTTRIGVGLTMDGGETWSDFLLRPPLPHQTNNEADPMTAYDDRTGTLWAGGISFPAGGGIFVARKEPGAATFEPSVMAVLGFADKCWMAAGPSHLDPAGSTRVYIGYFDGLLRSEDMGDTWQGPVSLGFGSGFLPRVGPSGEVFVSYWDFSDGVMLHRSFDGGASFGPPIRIATRMDVWLGDGSRFPGKFRVFSFTVLAVDATSGDLYCVYPDTTEMASNGSNVDLYFSRSTDQGESWTVPVVINEDAATPGDQFFPWIEVDRHGRIHMVYYDTRRIVQVDDQDEALIDIVYSYSDDAGDTWTETFLSDEPFSSLLDGFAGNFIGDYNGLTTAGNRTLPCYLSTKPNSNADIFVQTIQDGPSTSYCFGIGCPCGNDDPRAGCANSTGSGALLSSSGSDSVAADDLVLTVSPVKDLAMGLVFMGLGKQMAPFSNGSLCISGGGAGLYRFPLQTAVAGTLSEGPGIVAHSQASFPAVAWIQAGDTWNFQGWFRDKGGPCGKPTNLSNAITVSFTP